MEELEEELEEWFYTFSQQTEDLIKWCGYYQMTSIRDGDYFAIDATTFFKSRGQLSHKITFFVKFDGQLHVFDFEKSDEFIDNVLKARHKSLKLKFTFFQSNNPPELYGFGGTITKDGSMYNIDDASTIYNPIHYSVFQGVYKERTSDDQAVVHITNPYKDIYQIRRGTLAGITTCKKWEYNYNMQKFTAWSNYDDPNPALWLHMVGDASYGLACWYFIFDKSTNPRLLPMYKKPPSAARTVLLIRLWRSSADIIKCKIHRLSF